MGWFSTSKQDELESFVTNQLKEEEMSQQLSSYIERKAIEMLGTFKSKWEQFLKWEKASISDRITLGIKDFKSIDAYYIALAKSEEALAYAKPENKELYKAIIMNSVEELLKGHLSPIRLSNLFKQIYVYNSIGAPQKIEDIVKEFAIFNLDILKKSDDLETTTFIKGMSSIRVKNINTASIIGNTTSDTTLPLNASITPTTTAVSTQKEKKKKRKAKKTNQTIPATVASN